MKIAATTTTPATIRVIMSQGSIVGLTFLPRMEEMFRVVTRACRFVSYSPLCCPDLGMWDGLGRPSYEKTIRRRCGGGLRTPPRSATEGLRSCIGWETFGQRRWPGPETGPQREDRATTREACGTGFLARPMRGRPGKAVLREGRSQYRPELGEGPSAMAQGVFDARA